ncbi:MAG: hypothetical protein K8U57_06170 [Planctomycetes bacterium]|nr:hypothetical protein [Planctomycetota bacterium]
MCRFACVLAALVLVSVSGCGGGNNQDSNVKEKPKPQILTVEEFFADTNSEERDIRLVGLLKSWKGTADCQATIAGEKGKTCVIFVPSVPKHQQPGEDDAPKVGKWVIIDVRGSNQPVSRMNGHFTKGNISPGSHETQEAALKAAGR